MRTNCSYIHTCINCINTRLYINICIYSFIYAYTYTWVYMCIYTRIQMYMYTHIYSYLYIYVYSLHMYIHMYMYTYIDTYLFIFIYVCINIYVYICQRVNIQYICINIFLFVLKFSSRYFLVSLFQIRLQSQSFKRFDLFKKWGFLLLSSGLHLQSFPFTFCHYYKNTADTCKADIERKRFKGHLKFSVRPFSPTTSHIIRFIFYYYRSLKPLEF